MPNPLEALQNILSERRKPFTPSGNPDIPDLPPSPFMPDPPVLGGGPTLAKQAYKAMQMAPSLRGLVKSIQMGPTDDYITRMNQNAELGGTAFGAHEFPNTSLLGLTNTRTGNITLNPRLATDPYMQNQTLIHELAHVGSEAQTEAMSEDAEALFRQSQGNKRTSDIELRPQPPSLEEQLRELVKRFPGMTIRTERE